jgi:hypothetical protein
MNKLEIEKITEELKELRRPWYKKPEQWASYIAVLCTLAGVGFQYSLHDQNLLIAKNEKSLAEQEKIKAENERFLVVKERIKLGEKLDELKVQLKALIEDHNKALAESNPVLPEAKALITANLQFLAQIEKKTTLLTASQPTQEKTKYFSWIDSLLSAFFGLLTFVIGVLFLYGFLMKVQPELFPSLIAAIKAFSNKTSTDKN